MIARLFAGGLIAALMAVAANAQSLPPRRSFDIVTGTAAGRHFPVGELIARVVSHPPGLMRCEKSPLCGPPGVIVSARSSDGGIANARAVNDGIAASGLVIGVVLDEARAGRGDFAKVGRQTHLKVIADLYDEQVQLVVPRNAKIRSVADLKGRRLSLGGTGSATSLVATRILSAYGVRRAKRNFETAEAGADLLQRGKRDALFVLGPAPSPVVADLVARGRARLVAIDGRGRKRLLAAQPGLAAAAFAPGTFAGSPQVETVSTRVLWIVSDRAPADIVYGLVRALYHPGNRALLAQDPAPIRLPDAASLSRLPLHPGAARYYREIGRLK